MRKGQYMALESILSLTIGIAIATGSITMFTDYRDEVLSTGEAKQAEIIKSEMVSSLYTLKEAENGEMNIELPDQIGGNSYTISFGENLQITTPDETYTTSLQGLNQKYTVTGSADGGSVKVFKNGDQFILRDD